MLDVYPIFWIYEELEGLFELSHRSGPSGELRGEYDFLSLARLHLNAVIPRTFYHARKRGASVRHRYLKLLLKLFEAQIVEKNPARFKASLLGHYEKIALYLIARPQQIAPRYESRDGDLFAEEMVFCRDDFQASRGPLVQTDHEVV